MSEMRPAAVIGKSLSVLLLLILTAAPAVSLAVDTVPGAINYQGTLTDGAGQPISGTKSIIFSLYTVPSGGAAFWTSGTKSVTVANGSFSVTLGDSPAINPVSLTGTTYLGIKVESDPEMAPRQQFTSVAYALKAGNVTNLPDPIPAGAIMMWSGSIASIPAGWALCDGLSGRPNLKNKFLVGAGDEYAVGAAGGDKLHTLSLSEMPIHTHVQNAHGHSITDPGHTHSYITENDDGQNKMRAGTSGAGTYGPFSSSILANTTGISVVAQTATNQNTGGGIAFENRPPFYALCFIIKL